MSNNLPTRFRRQFDIEKYQNEDSWLQRRGYGIGASEGPAILGLSRWSNAVQLWGEKTGLLKRDSLDSIMLRTGHALENLNGEIFQERTGMELFNPGEYTIYQSRLYPHLFCTPDRIVTSSDKGKGICELKRSNVGIVERPEYYVQMQHSLAVTGYQWGCVCVVAMDSWDWFLYERNDKFIENLLRVYDEFWYCVQTKTMPAHEPSAAVNDTLKLLYTKDDGSHIVLPSSEFRDIDLEYARLSEQLKEANRVSSQIKAERDKLECRLREAIGTSTSASIEGGATYTLETTYKKAQEATSYRTLRRKSKKED